MQTHEPAAAAASATLLTLPVGQTSVLNPPAGTRWRVLEGTVLVHAPRTLGEAAIAVTVRLGGDDDYRCDGGWITVQALRDAQVLCQPPAARWSPAAAATAMLRRALAFATQRLGRRALR